MKKLTIIFVGIYISLGFKEDYKNSERQQNSAFTVIFMSSDSYDYKNNFCQAKMSGFHFLY